MSMEMLSSQRVSVQKDTCCFVVFVDEQPVLRCAARKDALQYAALVREALEHAGLMGGDSEAPRPGPRSRKIHN